MNGARVRWVKHGREAVDKAVVAVPVHDVLGKALADLVLELVFAAFFGIGEQDLDEGDQDLVREAMSHHLVVAFNDVPGSVDAVCSHQGDECGLFVDQVQLSGISWVLVFLLLEREEVWPIMAEEIGLCIMGKI